MSFYGKVTESPEVQPARSFTYTTWGGKDRQVEASYVSFMPDHVSFWLETDNEWDTLVIAEANRDVNSLVEVTP